jgi:hypothetical protein
MITSLIDWQTEADVRAVLRSALNLIQKITQRVIFASEAPNQAVKYYCANGS